MGKVGGLDHGVRLPSKRCHQSPLLFGSGLLAAAQGRGERGPHPTAARHRCDELHGLSCGIREGGGAKPPVTPRPRGEGRRLGGLLAALRAPLPPPAPRPRFVPPCHGEGHSWHHHSPPHPPAPSGTAPGGAGAAARPVSAGGGLGAGGRPRQVPPRNVGQALIFSAAGGAAPGLRHSCLLRWNANCSAATAALLRVTGGGGRGFSHGTLRGAGV